MLYELLFFASQEPNTSICPLIRTMLPLFTEDSKSLAKIMHAMRLIKQSIDFLNPCQIPVVASDSHRTLSPKKYNGHGQMNLGKIILLWFLADCILKWHLCQ